jgi:hypothetical protein
MPLGFDAAFSVADPLPDDLPLELREGEEDLGGHGGRRNVDLLKRLGFQTK